MDFILDALKDSLILLPFLFIAYIIIEVIEWFSAKHLEHSKLLAGRYSTLFGASFGLIPQCGFSVVATDLFAQKKIKIGTLIAVYIATSDEAVPLLLMNPDKILSLLPLLAIKLVLALIIGYSVDAIFSKYNKMRLASVGVMAQPAQTTETTSAPADQEHDEHENENHEEHENENHDEHDHEHHHVGCCGHDIADEPSKAKRFLLHPLIHTLKIFAFILIVNLLFGGLIQLVTEERLVAFLSSSKAFAPLLACIIGLIPNCASSVVITELYTIGGIGFGATVAGLIVNAGIAFVVLFKQNKNLKENFSILSAMFLIGMVTGYVIQLIGF